MKFEYNYRRKDLKNYLKSKDMWWIKLVYIFYFVLTISLCFNELKEFFIPIMSIIIIGFLVLYFVLKLLINLFANFLVFVFEKINPYLYGTYKCKISKDKIVTINNKYKVVLKKDDIKHIKVNDNVIEISSNKDKTIIIIEKVIIGNDLYNKAKEAVSLLK